MIIKAKESYFSVDEEESEHYIAYPVGGGFQVRIPKKEAIEVEGLPDVTIDCYASIDGGDRKYPCKANPFIRWNGWACPAFSEDVLNQIINEAGEKIVKKKTKDAIFFKLEDDDDESLAYLTKIGWGIDGWCWDLETEDGQFISSKGTVR